jgi:hypothetical protein
VKLPSLKVLWAKEPVAVATVLPLLVTVGVITQDQASAVTNAIAGAAAVLAQLAVAWKVRSKVSPVPKAPPA